MKKRVSDCLDEAVCYRLRRDALLIGAQCGGDRLDRSLVHWVQGQLVEAAHYDPEVPPSAKRAMVAFHAHSTHGLNHHRRHGKGSGAVASNDRTE